MALNRIGPIPIDHRNPQLRWSAPDDGIGLRAVAISGQAAVASVQQLSELVANPDRRKTNGGKSGVLEYIDMDGALVGGHRGWYLLASGDESAERPWSVTAFQPFSLAGVELGDNGQVVVSRSARARSNSFGLTPVAMVADPSWSEIAAGDPFVPAPGSASVLLREYDPTSPHSTPALTPALGTRSLLIYVASMVAGVDVLPSVVVPSARLEDSSWVANRGSDVRVFDRRLMREVYGPRHRFDAMTDIYVTNGLLRFRVGNRGLSPFVAVEAFSGGTWRAEGCVSLATATADVLRGARLVRLTPEVATVVLSVRTVGDVSVTLRRGARGLDIHHGADLPPLAPFSRSVQWRGMPPTMAVTGASTGTGKFGNGLALTGMIQWPWPPDQPKASWAFAFWWLPSASSASQPNSGLLALIDSAGLVGGVSYTASDRKLHMSNGATTLDSAALTFSAGNAVFVAVSLSPAGMALTVATPTQVAATVSNTSNASGTTDTNYNSFAFGALGAPYGSTTYGTGPYGGVQIASPIGGVIDNLMLFDNAITPTEAALLSLSGGRWSNLPQPESRMIWAAPFDTKVVPTGSLVTNGRRFETTAENGPTRAPDDWGLTKALAVLKPVSAVSPFGVSAIATHLDVYAYLATTTTNDDIAHHHAQYAAASEQEIRYR
jgi:hypothetical protein